MVDEIINMALKVQNSIMPRVSKGRERPGPVVEEPQRNKKGVPVTGRRGCIVTEG